MTEKFTPDLRQNYSRFTPRFYMKLPKPRKRGESYRIEFMYQGERYSCTRDTAKECEHWAASKLLSLQAGERQPIISGRTLTFEELFQKYNDEVGRKTPSAKLIQEQLNCFPDKVGHLANMQIHEITPKHLTAWRNKRVKEVEDGTVLREISLYSSIFSYAKKELFLLDTNPWFSVKKPKTPDSRYRRILEEEIAAIRKSCNYESVFQPKQTMHYVCWAFLFAIETAMRRGEILAIRRENVFDDHIHIPASKNGTKRDVPLSSFAKELLSVLDWRRVRAIPRTLDAFKSSWYRATVRAQVVDLHFHDTRHEASSRMVNERKIPVEVLAKITGHKNIKVLVNVYYNPRAEDIVAWFNR